MKCYTNHIFTSEDVEKVINDIFLIDKLHIDNILLTSISSVVSEVKTVSGINQYMCYYRSY